MQNIDPIYFLLPIAVIAISFGCVIYWRLKKCLTKWVLLYSFVAYFGAIALKYIVQIPTLRGFETIIGGNLAALGVYYGLQTVFFEVGGAYVVARYAVKKQHIVKKDAAGFGLSLAFWENGVYIGIFTLINFVTYYFILSSGNNSLSQILFNSLSKSSPGLFLIPSLALPSIGLSILERISSIIVHFSWGFLVVLSAVFRKKLFLAVALPMGLVDFFVPFAGRLGTFVFEFLIFGLALVCLAAALIVSRRVQTPESIYNEPS